MKDIKEYIGEGVINRKSTVVGASLEASLEDLKKYSEANRQYQWEKQEDRINIGPKGLELGIEDDDNIDLYICITDAKPNLQISYVAGDLTIEDSKIQNLEGIFTPDCKFAEYTTVMIKDCHNLISTKGLPKSLKNLGLIIKQNSPNIKFEGIPGDFDQANLMR